MNSFEKINYNENALSTSKEEAMLSAIGFKAEKIVVSLTNGRSAYAYVNVKVVNENKMPYEVFVFEGKAYLQVRISDHASNLERICGGSSKDKMSFSLFSKLVKDGVITQ
jgi:hypothetical protein